jgi:hypothetical protein
MRAGAQPVAVAGVSLAELIEFCARCIAMGIPESTKLRAMTDDQTALLSVLAHTPLASPFDAFVPADGEHGVVIDGGVVIDIPDED